MDPSEALEGKCDDLDSNCLQDAVPWIYFEADEAGSVELYSPLRVVKMLQRNINTPASKKYVSETNLLMATVKEDRGSLGGHGELAALDSKTMHSFIIQRQKSIAVVTGDTQAFRHAEKLN